MGDFIDYFDYLEDNTKECWANDIPVLKFSHISNDDFKYFIKESLIEIFTNSINNINKNICSDIELMKSGVMKSTWINEDEKVVRNYRSDSYYLIRKNLITCNKDDKNDINLYTYDMKTDEETEVTQDKKLTEEQTMEYVNFLNNIKKNIEKLNEEITYCQTELLKIRDISLSSDIIKSIVFICQYLFEYNEDLIEYYKNNGYIHTLNRLQERIKKEILEEVLEGITL
jgi:hypothetical protein